MTKICYGYQCKKLNKIYHILSGASLPISDREIGSQTFCHNTGLKQEKEKENSQKKI